MFYNATFCGGDRRVHIINFKELISDNDDIYIKYIATRSKVGEKGLYKLYVGASFGKHGISVKSILFESTKYEICKCYSSD